ncbi:MAG: alpha-L-rhamnosidase, partial [Gemmatimonadaceae bacterium]|nr:alpha-L-rhamnosidase [Chitinophagaceae bacterium]
MKYVLFAILLFASTSVQSQTLVNKKWLNKEWDAKWITCPDEDPQAFGVYHFKKTFTYPASTGKFIVHVSGDNRYQLFVNGKYVGNGPSRGDLMHWRFESFDIAALLKPGENIISATVWNFAEKKPLAQISYQTGFLLQADELQNSVVNTNRSWMVIKDNAYRPLDVKVRGFYAGGPGEQFDAAKHPWNWNISDPAVLAWPAAKETIPASPLKSMQAYGEPTGYVLVPREIPAMQETNQRFTVVRRSDIKAGDFLKGKSPLLIPANKKISILIDQGWLTNAYPSLSFSKGKEATIRLIYAEALLDKNNAKGNRNEIEGKRIEGIEDIVMADGGDDRSFRPLWWRTFRYVGLEIETKEQALTINDFFSTFTGFPLAEKARFECNDTSLTAIWKAGWLTQRLCAGETFFDCPYYEQLQYAGDARIQSLVSSYVSGDTTLMRNALIALNDSRFPDGLTQSRYPTNRIQIIPTFSLVWITMIHDYYMHCKDDKLIKELLPGVTGVLDWYEQRMDASGMVGATEWWDFVDWVRQGWTNGAPPGAYPGQSSVISLQYVYTLQKAALLYKAFGWNDRTTHYEQQAEKIKTAVKNMCFDEKKKLVADLPDKKSLSQHAYVLAVLTGIISPEERKAVMKNISADTSLAQCSYYFKFYFTEALRYAGLADQFTAT